MVEHRYKTISTRLYFNIEDFFLASQITDNFLYFCTLSPAPKYKVRGYLLVNFKHP